MLDISMVLGQVVPTGSMVGLLQPNNAVVPRIIPIIRFMLYLRVKV